MKLIDLTGQKFGRLTVIERAENKGKKVTWRCKCECGNIVTVTQSNLRCGNTRSCGCLRLDEPPRKTHGMLNTPIYREWGDMKNRCYYPKDVSYKNYGGRGIKICERWRNSFEAFYEDVSKLPHYGEDGYTLNRINNDGDYELGNVRWDDKIAQANNRRSNHLLEYNGKIQTIAQWAREYGLKYATLSSRITQYHWSVEKALTTPIKKH